MIDALNKLHNPTSRFVYVSQSASGFDSSKGRMNCSPQQCLSAFVGIWMRIFIIRVDLFLPDGVSSIAMFSLISDRQ
jgi:hypothetical protein